MSFFWSQIEPKIPPISPVNTPQLQHEPQIPPISPVNTPKLQNAQRLLKNAPHVDSRASLERAVLPGPRCLHSTISLEILGNTTTKERLRFIDFTLKQKNMHPKKCGTPGTQVFLLGSSLQKYYLIGGTPQEPVGFVGFRALSDFRVRGTRRDHGAVVGARGPQQCSGVKGGPAIK